MENKRPVGCWITMILGVTLLIMLILGQTMSFIDYDFTVSLGLQESRDVVGDMGIAVNKGFGVGDTIIYIPLLVIGLIGLWLRRIWGVFAMAAVFGITAYWPLVTIFFLLFARNVPGFNFSAWTTYLIMLVAISIYGLWGLWYVYTRRQRLVTGS